MMQINNACPTCLQVFTPEKIAVEVLPCRHRFHMLCLQAINSCRCCEESRRSLRGTPPVFTGSISKVAAKALHGLEERLLTLYFACLHKLTKDQPLEMPGSFHITMYEAHSPEDNVNVLFHRTKRWDRGILAETLKNLRLQEKHNWVGPYEQAAMVHEADVSVLVLNSRTEQFMLDKTLSDHQYEEWFILARRYYEERGFNKEKASKTFIINVKNDPTSVLTPFFKGIEHYHLSDLKSLYLIHLRIAGSYLKTEETALNRLLDSFQNDYDKLLSSYADQPA